MKCSDLASQPVLTTVRTVRWEKKYICDPLSVAVHSYYDLGIVNALVTVRFTQTGKFEVQLYDLSHKKRNSVILFSPLLLFLEAQTLIHLVLPQLSLSRGQSTIVMIF